MELAVSNLEQSIVIAQKSDLAQFKENVRIRIGKTDLGTPTPAQLENLFSTLQKIPKIHQFTLVSTSLEAKYFDLRDHSVNRTLVTLRTKSMNKVFHVLCTETFNCLNERDALRGCTTLAD